LIQIDLSNVWGELSLPDLLSIEKEIADAHAMLMEGTGPGAEFRGWLELPDRKNSGELLGILGAAEQIRSSSDVCVVVGIGGSCLSSRGVIELLQGPERNLTCRKGEPQILYAGNSLSTRQWNELKKLLEGGITDKEYRDAKQQLRCGYLMGLESPGSRMQAMGRQTLLLGKPGTPEDTIRRIEDVTKEDVMAVARRVLAAEPCIAVVGKGAEKFRV